MIEIPTFDGFVNSKVLCLGVPIYQNGKESFYEIPKNHDVTSILFSEIPNGLESIEIQVGTDRFHYIEENNLVPMKNILEQYQFPKIFILFSEFRISIKF